MSAAANAQEDLGYVRGVLERSNQNAFPAGIAYLWAAIGLVGFSLVDLAPQARTAGQMSARDGRGQVMHWGGLMVAIFLLYPLMAQGALQGEAIAQVILLFVALGYFLAGVHLIPALKWAALAMAIGYIVTITVDGFAWTTLGVLFAVGLVISARVAGGERGKQPA